jgi:4-diphosphocytidyl-2-C-methyl-D-erythritol kinase
MIDGLELEARAKINLNLFVVGKRPDGYHDIETLMQSIDLADTVCIKHAGEGIDVVLSTSAVPNGVDNIVYKAASVFYEYTRITPGVSVYIHKRIPVGAGLGGGSADAAAAIVGLDMLYETRLSEEELRELGAKCGSDVPFCIMGGTAVARGRGEILEPVDGCRSFRVVLAKPGFSVSTQKVYQSFCVDEKGDSRCFATCNLISTLQEGDLERASTFMYNDLEKVVVSSYPVILKIQEGLHRAGALGTLMSGSGPTVFGVFDDKYEDFEIMERCRSELAALSLTDIETILISRTVEQGIVLKETKDMPGWREG